MPVEVTDRYIRIRIQNPKQFIRFRTKTLGKGIKAIIGFRKGGGSQIQSLLFDKKRWTVKEARKWVKEHDMQISETVVKMAIVDWYLQEKFGCDECV